MIDFQAGAGHLRARLEEAAYSILQLGRLAAPKIEHEACRRTPRKLSTLYGFDRKLNCRPLWRKVGAWEN